jgi:hypothetical protein
LEGVSNEKNDGLGWGDQIGKLEGNDKENHMIDIRGMIRARKIEIVPMASPPFFPRNWHL